MWAERTESRILSPPSFAHLRRLTDDTGLLEHALGRIPRRREGYTTDDNARALWVVTEWLSLHAAGVAELGTGGAQKLAELAEIYMAFLLWNQQDDGWWHNNVAYDRTWEEETRSHDCQGRAVWCCADAWVRLTDVRRETAYVMLQRALPMLGDIASLRGQAYTMAACALLLEAGRDGAIRLPDGWAEELGRHLERLEALLCRAFRHFSGDRWRWFEPAMTYGNGILPWAMLRAYRLTRRRETLEVGLESLVSLRDAMTAPQGWLRPIGNAGWCTPAGTSCWDQQPLEIFKLALALEEAATLHLGRSGIVSLPCSPADCRAALGRCLSWFHGDNDHGAPMADPLDGSCCDGLQADGPNVNCGAEAALSYLMTHALHLRAAGRAK